MDFHTNTRGILVLFEHYKKCYIQKIFGPKELIVNKNSCPNKYCSKKNEAQKSEATYVLSKKEFNHKEILVKKKFASK